MTQGVLTKKGNVSTLLAYMGGHLPQATTHIGTHAHARDFPLALKLAAQNLRHKIFFGESLQ